MDTLIVPAPRGRGYGLLLLAAVLGVVAVMSDDAGRLLSAPAGLAALVLGVRDLVSGPVLQADRDGVRVLQGVHVLRVPWSEVERMRVVKDRRTEVLELDLGRTLALLSRGRLGRYPGEVLTRLLEVRAASGARSPAEPPAPS